MVPLYNGRLPPTWESLCTKNRSVPLILACILSLRAPSSSSSSQSIQTVHHRAQLPLLFGNIKFSRTPNLPFSVSPFVFVSNPIWDSSPPSLGFLDPMARKRKSEATGLDEVDRTMYSTFCTGANSLSQLYTQAMNQQKLSFQAGERHALEKLYQWILRQHEEGSRVTAADIVTHIQNEIDYGEDASMSPRLQSQYPHPQTAMHFTNPSASFGQATAGTVPRGAPSDQVKNSVFSNALSSPVRRSLQPYQLAQGGGCYPNGGQGARNHDVNSLAHNRANSPSSNDSSMDMHSDSPPHES